MNTVIGDVDRTIAKIGGWTIEIWRETPTAGWWHVTTTVPPYGEFSRTFPNGLLAAKEYREQCEFALQAKSAERIAA